LIAYPRVLPVGDAALTLELGDAIDPALNAAVLSVDEVLRQKPLTGVRETVPTYRSLLVTYDPARTDFGDLAAALLRVAGTPLPRRPVRRHTIPTVYGGEEGPDLAFVARTLHMSEEAVIAAHTGADLTAFMLGFSPGFAYLGLLPPGFDVPRRSTPRPRVPAGSVAVAGRQTGIYPGPTPGGWRLIGRTSLPLFDPFATPPARIEPGDEVRFERVRDLTPPVNRTGAAVSIHGREAIEVIAAGLLTTVQDAGRNGYRRWGVGSAGAADGPASVAANRAVGNPDGASLLEATLVGPTLLFLRPGALALGGADFAPVLEGPAGRRTVLRRLVPYSVSAGDRLRFEGRGTGCRVYIALAGGLDVPPVLGSRATDLAGGFGGFEGRALRPGDVLGVGDERRALAADPGSPAALEPSLTVRLVPGPQSEAFPEEAWGHLLGSGYRLSAESNRAGLRLLGPALSHRGPGEIVTDGVVPGCIQVPPDGQPIVTLTDGPTTGGYPKIGVVRSCDLPDLAQLVPGEGQLRFAI
jgi:KipI family sensor histidine kinase inhibitor